MSLRSFGIQTFTGVAQPAFGDVLTAASISNPSNKTNGIIAVADNTRYFTGDRLTLDPGLTNQDQVKIMGRVPASATQLYFTPEEGTMHPHAAGALVMLSDACAEIILEPLPGNAGPVYIGADATITLAPAGRISHMLVQTAAGTQPNTFRMANGVTSANEVRTSDIWVVGTAGDKFLASAVVV